MKSVTWSHMDLKIITFMLFYIFPILVSNQETAKLINRNETWSVYSTGDQDSQGSFTQRRLEARIETYGYRTGPDKPSHRLSLFSLSGLPGSPPRTPRLPPSKLSCPLPHSVPLIIGGHHFWQLQSPNFLLL